MGRAFEVRKASMAKTGAAKAKLYTKHSKEIYVAAKGGTPDPENNLALKHAIDKAKKNNVPADIVNRAIDKAKNAGGEDYQAARYEGFGPSGSTVIVDCLTDNVNRTVSDVKVCFTKTKNKMGVSGSVAHLYDNLGIIQVNNFTEDEVMELLIDNDIEINDIDNNDGLITIYVEATDLHKAAETLTSAKADTEIITEEIAMLAQIETPLEGEDLENFEKLITMLEDCDDVQEVYHSVPNLG